ncbi:MAG: DinB family protein [Saprospiraceae bacterium]|nr:DinB family protein [Saprospiraceae bacterium]
MEVRDIINKLEGNKAVFESLFSNVNEEHVHWRPTEGKWSFLEVACHLLDEERLDFRSRISSLFSDPTLPFDPIDPERWVETHFYAEKPYVDVCQNFLSERSYSIEWLKDVVDEDWGVAYDHPKFGPMSARFLLDNWLAHDLLHINQWNRMHYRFLLAQGMDLGYAGKGL